MPTVLDGDFIVALTAEQKVIEARLREPYLRRRFHLRDSMEECTVWFRESLFDRWFSGAGHGKLEHFRPEPAKSSTKDPELNAAPSPSSK